MTTTTSKVSKAKKETANEKKNKNPRATCVVSRKDFLEISSTLLGVYKRTLLLFFTEHKEEIEGSKLFSFLNLTNNGTFKYTIATPELKEDVKGSLEIGDKKFYKIPSSLGLKGMFSGILTCFDIEDAKRVWQKKLDNTKNFSDWVNSSEAKKQFDAFELLTGEKVTEGQKKTLYKKYLNDRGLEEIEDEKA